MDVPDQAKTIRDAYRACELGALGPDKQHWRVDLSGARASDAVTRLETYFEFCDPGEWAHVAFTGHRGSGKSTELLRLKQKWEQACAVIYFKVTDLLDPNDIAFSDLFLTVSMRVAQAFHDMNMGLDKRLLKSVEDFAAQVIRESTHTKASEIKVGAEAKAQGTIPFVAKLSAWITSQFKASTQHKVTIRRIMERDITRLITDTNLLLDNAREKLRKAAARSGRGPRDLLIIIDNLDRVPPDVGERLVFQHGDFLKQLRANVIYTIPVSVLHSTKGLERVFPKHDILPMIKVLRWQARKIHLDWDETGVDALVGAVDKRIDTQAVFENDVLVRELARQSGGCLRHLMQLVCYACHSAAAREHAKVTQRDVQDALARIQFDFERMIPPEHYPLLAEVARTRNVPNNDLGRAALFNLSVLEYNGVKRWNYVHPLVRRIDRFEAELRGRARKRKR